MLLDLQKMHTLRTDTYTPENTVHYSPITSIIIIHCCYNKNLLYAARVFLENPSEPPLAHVVGTQIALTCRVAMEYRVVWIVEIPGMGRLESEDSAAISALQEEGFAIKTTYVQDRENRLTITGSLRNNLATVQCAAVDDVRNTKTRYVNENIITVKFYGKMSVVCSYRMSLC